MSVPKLSAKHLLDLSSTPSSKHLGCIFYLAGMDEGLTDPGLTVETSLGSILTEELDIPHDSIHDFVYIPRDLVKETARELRLKTGSTTTRTITPKEVGRTLRAHDFATELQRFLAEQAEKLAAEVLEEAAAALLADPNTPKAPPPTPVAENIKLSQYISLELNGTAVPMDRKGIKDAEDSNKARLGILPLDSMMPSEEQLSCLKHVLDHDITPYVDFALWGPFNRRFVRRKATLLSYTPDVDTGTWKPSHVLPGPATFESWHNSWLVFRTAMIMLCGADTQRLDQYASFIRTLFETYSAKCWWLISQADTRLRSEKLGRFALPRPLEDGTIPAGKANWSIAFTKAVDIEQPGVSEFWNTEVHRPAQQYTNGAAPLSSPARDNNQPWSEPASKRRRGRDNRNSRPWSNGPQPSTWQDNADWKPRIDWHKADWSKADWHKADWNKSETKGKDGNSPGNGNGGGKGKHDKEKTWTPGAGGGKGKDKGKTKGGKGNKGGKSPKGYKW